jgi:hypothetical protein
MKSQIKKGEITVMARLVIWLIYRVAGRRVGRIVSGSVCLFCGLILLVAQEWLYAIVALLLGGVILWLGIKTPSNKGASGLPKGYVAGQYWQGQPQNPQLPASPYGQQPYQQSGAGAYGQPAYPYPQPQAAPYGQLPYQQPGAAMYGQPYPQQPGASPYGQPPYQYPQQ